MEKRKLGRSNLEVSAIGLSCISAASKITRHWTRYLLASTVLSLSLLVPAPVHAIQAGGAAPPAVSGKGSQTIKITRRGTQSSQQGPAENFTGSVGVTPLFAANDPSRASGGSVSFEPGARSAWHTHPQGQVLIVTAGIGRVQQWGGPVEEIRVGDVVWTPPGVKHWHGASPNTAMTHIAIQEHLDGKAVDWLEKVSDQQYGGLPAISREEGASTMANEPQARPNPYADIAPALGEITNKVLFGEVWERPGLSPRDRSLITVATLVATYRTNELPFHLERALENGVTRDEISELITHLAFYAGWPAANTAVLIARDVFKKREK